MIKGVQCCVFYFSTNLSISSGVRQNKKGGFEVLVGIDFGSQSLQLVTRDGSVKFDDLSAVSLDLISSKVVSIGREATQMVGRTDVEVLYPVSYGNIENFDAAVVLLKKVGQGFSSSLFRESRAVVAVPVGLSHSQRVLFREVFQRAGFSQVQLIPSVLAALSGAMKEPDVPQGTLVVDIGAGCTNVAVVCRGNVVIGETIPISGKAMDEAIIRRIRKDWGVSVSRRQAEDLKEELGSVYPVVDSLKKDCQGRELMDGTPQVIEVSADIVREALEEPTDEIVSLVGRVLEAAPPELSGDIARSGIHLTGGCSQLNGMVELFSETFGVPTHCLNQPRIATSLGLCRNWDDTLEL